MGQLLLMPDPRPLEERLGGRFFREAPKRPGVYLMRDAADRVVYVGKAGNLQQRLRSYRIANPDRMPRRHLRMVREVARIELLFCADESAALQCESKLLRSLKPRFNRSGVWPGKTRFLVWRRVEVPHLDTATVGCKEPLSPSFAKASSFAGPPADRTAGRLALSPLRGAREFFCDGHRPPLQPEERLELAVTEVPETGWQRYGPLGMEARHLHGTLARLLWLAMNPARGWVELPAGWGQGKVGERVAIQCGSAAGEVAGALAALFWEGADGFVRWLEGQFSARRHAFERGVIEGELEVLTEFSARHRRRGKNRRQLALL